MRDFAMLKNDLVEGFSWQYQSRMIVIPTVSIDGLIHGNRDDDEQAMLNQTKQVPSGKLEAGKIGKVWWLPSSSPFQLPIEAAKPPFSSFHDLVPLCQRRLRLRQPM
jgi:hypothetical protein